MAIARITSGTRGRRVFDVWSFDNYTMDLDMPIEVFAIPEEDAENAQLIKAQGNILTVTLNHGVQLSLISYRLYVDRYIACWSSCFRLPERCYPFRAPLAHKILSTRI